jgi:hypothetical protein
MVDETEKIRNSLKETGFFKPKKVFDGGKVFIGIVVFCLLVGFPFLYNRGKAANVPEPELDTPIIRSMPSGERLCVESKEYMRDNHMKLLDEWRDEVVREARGDYVASTKKRYTISLQKTCLECHSNYNSFCERCHAYTGINPYCWDCHLDKPKEWAAGKVEGEGQWK